MKRLIASLLVLVLGANMVMAEMPLADSYNPFAGVEGTEMSTAEAGAIKGGVAPLAAFVVGVAVRAAGSAIILGATEYVFTGKVTAKNVIRGAVAGAVTGGVGGIFAKSSTTVAQMASSAAKGAIASGAGAATATVMKKLWR